MRLAARRIGIVGGLLLLDERRSRLLAYNEFAGLIWDALAAGASPEEIVAEAGGAEAEGLLRQWLDEGLIGPDLAAPAHEGTEPVPPVRSFEVEWSVDLGGRAVTLAVEKSERSEPLRSLLGHLEIRGAGHFPRIELREAGDGAAAVVRDGCALITTSDPGLLVGAVYQSLLELIRPGADWMCLIHGGAVALGGKGIGLPAPSGNGKTTLVAALAAQGFDYLADDLLAVAAPEGRIVPWPMPLSVKPGSFDALAPLYPGLRDAPTFRTKGMDARLIVPEGEPWHRPPVPLTALVVPRYREGSDTELVPLRPIEMLARLLGDRIWLGHPLEQARVERFAAWLSSLPSYELRYSRLAEAPQALADPLQN